MQPDGVADARRDHARAQKGFSEEHHCNVVKPLFAGATWAADLNLESLRVRFGSPPGWIPDDFGGSGRRFSTILETISEGFEEPNFEEHTLIDD